MRIRPILASCFVMAVATQANAEVRVHSVSYQEGEGLIVQGNDFGHGPAVAVHDDFNHGGNVGDVVDTNRTIKGSWYGNNSHYPTLYSSKARSGSHGALMFDKSAGRARTLESHFDNPAQEVFLSYWVRLGENRIFPGRVSGGAETFSEDSSWKFTWLMDKNHRGEDTDLALPTHVGNGKMMLAGNSHHMGYISNGWWSWGDWMRITVWLKPDMAAPYDKGHVLFQTLSGEHGLEEKEYNRGIFPENDHEPNQFQKINIPGWVRTSDSSEATVHYDDIYVATGSSAAARVEIGNKENYSDNTELFILSHKDWNDDRIVANVPSYWIDGLSEMYVYVTNADGKVNKSGIPLGDSAPDVVKRLNVE